MQINFIGQTWKEGNAYVSYAPQLDVSTCGKTQEEARKNLIEAVEGFIEVTQKMGTLQDILKEAGFIKQVKKQYWVAPELIALERFSLAI